MRYVNADGNAVFPDVMTDRSGSMQCADSVAYSAVFLSVFLRLIAVEPLLYLSNLLVQFMQIYIRKDWRKYASLCRARYYAEKS